MAKTDTFTDPFDLVSLRTANWGHFTGGGATLSYATTGATCTFPASSTASTDGDLTSQSSYDLTSSYIYLHVISVPSAATHADATFGFQDSSIVNGVFWLVEAGVLYAQKLVGGVITNVFSVTYNSTTHAYWRIRESGGTTFWDTSPDGTTWTNQHNEGNPISLTALFVTIGGICFQAESNPGTFKWNNFNTLAFDATKTQTAIAKITKTFTKTQTATAKILPQNFNSQTATARIKRTNMTKTQSAIAKLLAVSTKTQTAIANLVQRPFHTQTATARIVFPPPIQLSYDYKVYSATGQYMGLLPNVKSTFTPSQDINTVGSQITVTVGKSADTAAQQSTTTIDDETGDPLQDEAGNPLLSEGGGNIIGLGADNTLIKNGNKVVVIEYSRWHPTGITRFRGDMERWEASFGGDGADEAIDILVYSDGRDMDETMLQGSPLTADVTQSTNNHTYTIQETNTDKLTSYNRAGQTWKTSAGITNLGGIGVFMIGPVAPVNVTVKVYQSVSDANAGINLLASATVAVSGNGSSVTEFKFQFASPIAVTAATSYFFTVTSEVGKSIAVAYQQSDILANADMYLSFYSGSGSPTAYTITPTDTIAALSDMAFKTYSNAGATTAVYTTQDPTTGILADVITQYNQRGGLVTSGSIDATGLSLTYTFNTQSVLEGLNTVLSLSPDGFYYYVDLGTSQLNFKNASSSADIKLTKDKHIDKLKLVATIENVKNYFYFTGGDIGAGSNLFKLYKDQTSIGEFGARMDRKTDNRVTLSGTADAIGNSFISENKDEQFQTTATILHSAMDLTRLHVGLIIGFNGFGNFIDNLLLQIVRVDWTPEEATLTLGVLPPRVNITLAQITRDLLAQQTINNPSSPS